MQVLKAAGAKGAWVLRLLLWAGAIGVCRPALAHEKWFHSGQACPTCWCTLAEWRPIAAIAAVAAATLAAAFVWRRRRRRDLLPGPRDLGATPDARAAFYGWVPGLLAAHLAVPLLVCGLTGALFSPNNPLVGAWRPALGFLQIACAVALFYGAATRAAAVVLAATWLAGIGACGAEAMLENAHYLGFAAFFFCAGRGPHAVDRALFPCLEPPPRLARWAMPSLRLGVGISLGAVAFTEKLANPALAASFLRQHPLNFTPLLHMPMCDATFALCAGAVELLIGCWLVAGLFPRAVLLLAWVPFNLTLTFFQWHELAGHLPFYGALAALLVWTPAADDQVLWMRGVTAPAADETGFLRQAGAGSPEEPEADREAAAEKRFCNAKILMRLAA